MANQKSLKVNEKHRDNQIIIPLYTVLADYEASKLEQVKNFLQKCQGFKDNTKNECFKVVGNPNFTVPKCLQENEEIIIQIRR